MEEMPPINLTELLTAEGLDDWPVHMSFENPLDIQSDGLLISTQEDIITILNEAAPVQLDRFDEVEKKLAEIQTQLNFYLSVFAPKNKGPYVNDDQLFRSQTAFLTEFSELNNPQHSRDSSGCKNEIVDIVLQTKIRGLDFFKFPGFKHEEFTELPANLEASEILNQVLTAQSFKPRFRKLWNKIFLSEASCALLQDSFWWIFLDKFNKEGVCGEDKDLLFNRIAHSYTALFTSIRPDLKDSFVSVYPNCLLQALYCTYKEAFPESRSRFNEEFKHYLVNLIYEWIAGLHPLPGLWKTWNEEDLKLEDKSRDHATTKKLLEATAVNSKVEFSLDVESYIKVVDALGTSDSDFSQEHTSRNSTKSPRGKSDVAKTESHQLGPNAEVERVKFNISGRSPLIAHYLNMKQHQTDKQPGMKIRRTEIRKLPADRITYQEFITNTMEKSELLSKAYARACEKTSAEILDIQQQQRTTTREINKLRKALTYAKNAQERCTAIEAVEEYNECKQKEMSLLEDQSLQLDSDESASYDEDSLNIYHDSHLPEGQFE